MNQVKPQKSWKTSFQSSEIVSWISRMKRVYIAHSSADAAIVQNQLHRQDGTEMDLSPLPGPLSLQERVQGPEQPAGWTDVMTGWVRYLLQQGTELSAVESGMRSIFPSINDMVGVKQHLEYIKTEWEGREV